jgi:hypothetical protein
MITALDRPFADGVVSRQRFADVRSWSPHISLGEQRAFLADFCEAW